MQHSKEHIHHLWSQYLAKKATPQELNQLFSVLADPAMEEESIASLQAQLASQPLSDRLYEDYKASLLQTVLASGKENQAVVPVHRVHFLRTAWFRYAAAVIAIVGISCYLWI